LVSRIQNLSDVYWIISLCKVTRKGFFLDLRRYINDVETRTGENAWLKYARGGQVRDLRKRNGHRSFEEVNPAERILKYPTFVVYVPHEATLTSLMALTHNFWLASQRIIVRLGVWSWGDCLIADGPTPPVAPTPALIERMKPGAGCTGGKSRVKKT
jgi:hypothetical protein